MIPTIFTEKQKNAWGFAWEKWFEGIYKYKYKVLGVLCGGLQLMKSIYWKSAAAMQDYITDFALAPLHLTQQQWWSANLPDS